MFKSQAINTISQRKSKGPVISQSNGVNHPLPVSIRYLWAILFLCRQIPLCKYTVHRIFWDNLSFYSLSCRDSLQDRVSNMYGLCIFVMFEVFPLFLIVLSYIKKIIMLSLKASRSARRKAFETCTPHLIIFINFSLASFFSVIYNRISLNLSLEVNILQSINYNLVPPLLHPIIYGIKKSGNQGEPLKNPEKGHFCTLRMSLHSKMFATIDI